MFSIYTILFKKVNSRNTYSKDTLHKELDFQGITFDFVLIFLYSITKLPPLIEEILNQC
jgi:hypothetical protein